MLPCQSPQGLVAGYHTGKGGKEVTEYLLSITYLIYIISFNPQNNLIKMLPPPYYLITENYPPLTTTESGSEKVSFQPTVKHKGDGFEFGLATKTLYAPLTLWALWEPRDLQPQSLQN